jgi:carotenoid cleavage dioxygenase
MPKASVVERAASWTSRLMQKRVPYSSANPFLEGAYAPVREERTETELRVTGSLPPELSGLYARIGPNPIDVPNPALHHWFVGDGMVHGVRLREGRALWYRNRWIGSMSVTKALGRPEVPGPRRGVADAVNTNVIRQGGRLWALVEAGALPVELSSELESVRHSYFESDLSRAFSAHPHRDPVTGDLHAVCYDGLVSNRISYVRVDPNCRVTRVVEIPVKHGPMVHDCALTASSVVILDLPVTFSMREIVNGTTFPYHWNPAHEARVGLLPRDGEAHEIRWFHVDPCYVFHTCNAYDRDDGSVVLDAVVHSSMFDRSRQGPDSDRITFERWTLGQGSGDVRRTVISDEPQEFPRYDERYSAKPQRYAYTVGFTDQPGREPLIRHDLSGGPSVKHDFGPHHVTAESVFVPRSADAAENDGWLISYVYDLREGRSDFVVVNAADLAGAPQAVVHLPVPVPLGFHGNWMPDPV